MLKVENLSCRTGSFLLDRVDMESGDAGYFVLLGPTGSGKTTLAKCVCGLLGISGGRIMLNGRNITAVAPEGRKIGYLPQDFALFPNMSAGENIVFSPSVKGIPPEKYKKRFTDIVDALDISSLLERSVDNLSGGEKQRAALGRALMAEPDVFILDEPFSSIDEGLKTGLWFEMKDFLRSVKIPVLHITHNLDEAALLAESMAVLIEGRAVQSGSRDAIFSRPASEKVAQYLGIRNIYSGRISQVTAADAVIEGDGFSIRAPAAAGLESGMEVRFSVAPQAIKIIKEGIPVRNELKDNIFDGVVASSHFLKDSCILKVKSVLDFELNFPAFIYQRHGIHNGKKIKVGIWRKGVNIFRKEG